MTENCKMLPHCAAPNFRTSLPCSRQNPVPSVPAQVRRQTRNSESDENLGDGKDCFQKPIDRQFRTDPTLGATTTVEFSL